MTAPAAWPHTTETVGPEKHPPPGLPVFGWVNDRIARSGQPTAEGLRWLAQRNFRTIVSLRDEGPDDLALLPGSLAFDYFRFRWVDEEAPTAEIAEKFLALAHDPARWPMLVHCHAGRGRTSVACALLRHQFDGWWMTDEERDNSAQAFHSSRICWRPSAMEEVRLYRVVARPLGIPVRWPLARVQRDWLAAYGRSHAPGVWTR